MSLEIQELARRLETLKIGDPTRRSLNGETLVCISKWLSESELKEWRGFTHLRLPLGRRYPKGWMKLEVLLDAIVFQPGLKLPPLFGAELEWSRRRKRSPTVTSSKFLRNLRLQELVRGDQAMRDRAYDLCRLLTVRPEIMLFLAREDSNAEHVLEDLKNLAVEISRSDSAQHRPPLLLGMLGRTSDKTRAFITCTL